MWVYKGVVKSFKGLWGKENFWLYLLWSWIWIIWSIGDCNGQWAMGNGYYIEGLKKNRNNEGIAHFLFFGEWCEWIAHFAQIKWAMQANRSFRSPKMSDHEQVDQVAKRKWAMWANQSPKMSEWEWIDHFWSETLIFGKKTSVSLENQMSVLPNSQPCVYTISI